MGKRGGEEWYELLVTRLTTTCEGADESIGGWVGELVGECNFLSLSFHTPCLRRGRISTCMFAHFTLVALQ